MTTDEFKAARQTFIESYDRLYDILDTIPADRRKLSGACGDWSPQQIVAHLSGWVQEAIRRYGRYAVGTGNIHYNIDNFNAVSVRERQHLDWDEQLAELRQLVDALTNQADTLRETLIERDDRYAKWLNILAEDVTEHTEQLIEFNGKSA